METLYTSFWRFIQNTDLRKLEIPIIQRDYAQGREGKEMLRFTFLTSLKSALDGTLPNDEKILTLDFVYGSKVNGTINPLDGQQRLTTLWLLHWYIALRAGTLNDAQDLLAKFTYETRMSSREFCEKLCDASNFKEFTGNDIVQYIQDQTWFYSSWKQDPTVQSMLRMLKGSKPDDKTTDDFVDGIEELFGYINDESSPSSFVKYWNTLTGDDCPIVFYYLPLEDFGLSDDLYIKMNARGEQLTSYENFKADLVGYIRNKVKDAEFNNDTSEEAECWKELNDPQTGFGIKMDTIWTDTFWKNRSASAKIDEISFAFINRFFFDTLFTFKDGGEYFLQVGKVGKISTIENENISYSYLNDSEHTEEAGVFDSRISYQGLRPYLFFNKEIPLAFFQRLSKILDNYKDFGYECKWDKGFHFIPKYAKEKECEIEIKDNADNRILKVTTLNQVQRIIFHSVCRFFDTDDESELTDEAFKNWMRVCWNLVSGEDQNGRPQIRSTEAMRRAIEFIDSLNPHTVYESLKRVTISGNSEFDERCKEEKEKAVKILEDNALKEKIYEAEGYAFFKGSIRFLYRQADGTEAWENFDRKFDKAKKYFDEYGVLYEKQDSILLRAFLSRLAGFPDESIWFDNSSRFWRWLLLNQDYQEIVHEMLNEDNFEIKSSDTWLTSNLLSRVKEGRWHIMNDWRGHKVLTRYAQRVSGNLTSPNLVYAFWNERNQQLQSDGINCKYQYGDSGLFYGWDVMFSITVDGKEYYFSYESDGKVYQIDKDSQEKIEGVSPLIAEEIKPEDFMSKLKENFKLTTM